MLPTNFQVGDYKTGSWNLIVVILSNAIEKEPQWMTRGPKETHFIIKREASNLFFTFLSVNLNEKALHFEFKIFYWPNMVLHPVWNSRDVIKMFIIKGNKMSHDFVCSTTNTFSILEVWYNLWFELKQDETEFIRSFDFGSLSVSALDDLDLEESPIYSSIFWCVPFIDSII